MLKCLCLLSLYVILCSDVFAQPAKRLPRPGDIYRMQTMADANISPDGQWIAYTISTIDSAKDKRNSDIWMVSRDGKQTVQLISSPDNESTPRWSPDGKTIAYTRTSSNAVYEMYD